MKATILAGAVLSSMWISTAMADHNSIWGEGWANMPNDIHNTRIDTLDSDNDSFIDFVRYGNGADSVNRFDDSTAVAVGSTTATRSMGSARAGGNR